MVRGAGGSRRVLLQAVDHSREGRSLRLGLIESDRNAFDHVGLEGTGLDFDHLYAEQPELASERVRVRFDRVLAHCVGAVERRCGLPPGFRADVDDAPPARSNQGQKRLVHPVRPQDVDVENPGDAFFRDVGQRPDPHDSREVHDGLELIRTARDSLERALDAFGICHVQGDGNHVRVVGRAPEQQRIDIGRKHPPPLHDEPLHRRVAEATTRSCDECTSLHWTTAGFVALHQEV